MRKQWIWMALLGAFSLPSCSLLFDEKKELPNQGDAGIEADGAIEADVGVEADAHIAMMTINIADGVNDSMEDQFGGNLLDYGWLNINTANHLVGLRFLLDGNFSRIGEVKKAYIEFYVDDDGLGKPKDNADSVDDPLLLIYGELGDSAAFTGAPQDIADRSRTVASVVWNDTNIGAGWNESPGVTSIVQELMQQQEWEREAITFILQGNQGKDDERVAEFRQFEFDVDGATQGEYSAKLVILYVPAR